MNGAQALIQSAVKAGIKVCFSNPGTTEMPVVAAMEDVPGIEAILCLFEGVCTGAADGYGRMLDKPAMTLLHLGPGLANGIANLHNARRAHTPIVNIVGEHSTWHRQYDPPLTMDIEALAGTFSGWQRTCESSQSFAQDMADAVTASLAGHVATLVVPYDYQLATCDVKDAVFAEQKREPVDMKIIDQAAQAIQKSKKAVLVLGGKALRKDSLMDAARIKSAAGCELLAETFPAHMERGAGLPDINRIPYLPEMALDLLSPYDVLVFAGAKEPVSFFGYEGIPASLLNHNQKCFHIARESQNIQEALAAFADALNASASVSGDLLAQASPRELPQGALAGDRICSVLAALQPEGSIVVEEAITNSLMYHPLTAGAAPFSLLTLTGGSLGQGPACSVGAAVACPDRPVINFQADGAAMYTLQALWTQARLGLDVTTLICSNRSYDILKLELSRLGIIELGKTARSLTDLAGIDWVKLGEGLGVPSTAVVSSEELARAFQRSTKEKGPHLIEMML
jgi:acetolactate synthase-1/2/3 large subunit